MTSVKPISPSRVPLILGLVFMALLGYSVGRFQGGLETSNLTERLESAQADVKRSQEAILNVEARSRRVEGQRYLTLALEAFSQNEDQTAQEYLRAAGGLINKGAEGEMADIGKQLISLSKSGASASEKKKRAQDLAARIDALQPVAAPMGGGASS